MSNNDQPGRYLGLSEKQSRLYDSLDFAGRARLFGRYVPSPDETPALGGEFHPITGAYNPNPSTLQRMPDFVPMKPSAGVYVRRSVMKNNLNDIPTVGEWLRSLPQWKQTLFGVVSRLFGDDNAFIWLGYYRDIKRRK